MVNVRDGGSVTLIPPALHAGVVVFTDNEQNRRAGQMTLDFSGCSDVQLREFGPEALAAISGTAFAAMVLLIHPDTADDDERRCNEVLARVNAGRDIVATPDPVRMATLKLGGRRFKWAANQQQMRFRPHREVRQASPSFSHVRVVRAHNWVYGGLGVNVGLVSKRQIRPSRPSEGSCFRRCARPRHGILARPPHGAAGFCRFRASARPATVPPPCGWGRPSRRSKAGLPGSPRPASRSRGSASPGRDCEGGSPPGGPGAG